MSGLWRQHLESKIAKLRFAVNGFGTETTSPGAATASETEHEVLSRPLGRANGEGIAGRDDVRSAQQVSVTCGRSQDPDKNSSRTSDGFPGRTVGAIVVHIRSVTIGIDGK